MTPLKFDDIIELVHGKRNNNANVFIAIYGSDDIFRGSISINKTLFYLYEISQGGKVKLPLQIDRRLAESLCGFVIARQTGRQYFLEEFS